MPRLSLITLLLAGSLVGCGSAGSPVDPGTGPTVAPSLLTPQAGVPIRQNDSTTGCPFSVTHGYGFQVGFSWSAVPGAADYHLVLHHAGSVYAAIDTIVTGTALQVLECNAYVIDANLHDWHWTVSGRSPSGDEGSWAAERLYEFEPMSLPPRP